MEITETYEKCAEYEYFKEEQRLTLNENVRFSQRIYYINEKKPSEDGQTERETRKIEIDHDIRKRIAFV